MATSIIKSKETNGKIEYTYYYEGSIRGQDVYSAYNAIMRYMDIKGTDSIIFDISRADSVVFKPNRIWGLTTFFDNYISERNSDISFKFIINNEQIKVFKQINEFKNITISVNESNKIICKENVLSKLNTLINKLIGLNVKDIMLNSLFFIKLRYIGLNIQPAHLINIFVCPLFIFCVFVCIVGISFYKGTLFGMILSIVSAVLGFESFVVIKIYQYIGDHKKTHNKILLKKLFFEKGK